MKNSVIQVDGKFYIKSQVVMLPTNDKKATIVIDDNSQKLNICFPEEAAWGHQHLYFLSDEEIKEGDWYFCNELNNIQQCTKILDEYKNRKKIIATTDESLLVDIHGTGSVVSPEFLPRPSNEFLKKYCELGGINEVMIEVETIQTTKKEDYQYSNGNSNLNYKQRIKVSPDNTITIKPIKDNWSREEIKKILLDISPNIKKLEDFPNDSPDHIKVEWGMKKADWITTEVIDNWIKQNL